MEMMKNNRVLLSLVLTSLLTVSCYEKYVLDYDYSGVYVAYQYDLRSFVVGEGMSFRMGVVLGGVINNNSNRDVFIQCDNSLVNGNLSKYWPGASPFTATDAILGKVSYGTVSQSYVKTAVEKAGITSLTPLPESSYSLSSESMITIAKGNHTGTIEVKADSTALLSLPDIGSKPFYALGLRIRSADADTVLFSKSYQVVALRIENMMFGNWYRGGYSEISSSEGVKTNYYRTQIPCDENSDKLYKLTTYDASSVVSNYLGSDPGSLRIQCLGDDLKLLSSSTEITDLGSSYNKAKLLQDRKMYLNYRYTRTDGSVVTVHDTLTFRNRVRDGVNEWQDEIPSHYSN